MKILSSIILLTLLLLTGGCSDENRGFVGCIPHPQKVELTEGRLEVTGQPKLVIDAEKEIAQHMTTYLMSTALFTQENPSEENTFDMVLTITDDETPENAEGYRLEITSNGVKILARKEQGLFYGVQTFLQLKALNRGQIAAQKIIDSPRFQYRGLHIDVSRNFFSKEFLMKQMDAMASMKLNRLHLHLTDGAGWRLEIEKYPKLTQFAAWRIGKTWQDWRQHGQQYAMQGSPNAEGGYYTKDDIRELVKYAEKLHITIIPEIEMPGHSEEVVAAYPELGCSQKTKGQSSMCVGNEKTFEFLENVLTEVVDLFPSKYIHVGGDEASKSYWSRCQRCQKRMQEEGLQSVDELQSYLIKRIERFLHSKGRKLMGWDEILEGGLAPDATVMSWRGEDGGRQAAAAGHHVVMTPGGYCYFDGYQDSPQTEPQAMSGYLTTNKVYQYDPAPDEMKGKEMVLGVQANLWTEYIPTASHAEYMLYPRLCALAEVAWSNKEVKDYVQFLPRVYAFTEWLKEKGYTTFNLKESQGERPVSLNEEKHLAVGCEVKYASKWAKRYAAAEEKTLTDGLHGSWYYNERWQGFLNQAVDVVVDLGEKKQIKKVKADFMQWKSAWIWLPKNVSISISDDGKEFKEIENISLNISQDEEKPLYETYSWEGNEETRYIRLYAIPNGIEGGWLFTDEISIH